MEAYQLEVSSDSQLVVKQIEDSYEAKGEKMILYLKKVQELLKKFYEFRSNMYQDRRIPELMRRQNWLQPHKKTWAD